MSFTFYRTPSAYAPEKLCTCQEMCMFVDLVFNESTLAISSPVINAKDSDSVMYITRFYS